MIEVTVNTNLANLEATARVLTAPRPLVAAAAQAIAVTLKKHFQVRNAEGNQQGWPRSNFWKKEGTDKTAVDAGSVTDDAAVVQVSSEKIAHKLLGGTIRPGPGRQFLSIPLTAAAKKAGKPSNKVIPDLQFIQRKGQYGRAFLAITKGKGKTAYIEPQYLLLKSVTQASDPRTLPPEADLQTAAQRAVDAALARAIRTQGTTP